MRKIGNSLGVIIQSEEARRQGIAEGDEVLLEVESKTSPKSLFGKYSFSKSTQELKDEAREGWD